ncbi:MAG: hypothetical protein IJP18_00685 [Oscillospiraceae bacterium]|nr:hypothetical protein [Oscillospiraceae bacterium]MBQ9981059.1 hypothetical protein [Oscillospiraceae bacterium]
MKKFKTVGISAIVAFTIVTGMTSVNVNAEQTTGINAVYFGGGEWEFTCEVLNGSGNHIGEFCYGYDMTLVNEDYTWARSSDYSCKAGVCRNGHDSGYLWGFSKNNNEWSKKELTHKDDNVSYCMNFDNDYVGAVNGISRGSSYK